MKSFKKLFALVICVSLVFGTVPSALAFSGNVEKNYKITAFSNYTEDLPLGTNLLKGKTPSTAAVKNGVACSSGTMAPSSNGIKALTDGDVNGATGGVHFSNLLFLANDGETFIGPEGKTYGQFQYDLGSDYAAKQFFVVNHSSRNYRTYHYKIYASDSTSTLYNDENIIADFYNDEWAQTQLFNVSGGKLKFKYVALRVYDPTCSHNAPGESHIISPDYAYIRLFEFGVTGDSVDNVDYINHFTKVDADNTNALLQPENRNETDCLLNKNIDTLSYKYGTSKTSYDEPSPMTSGIINADYSVSATANTYVNLTYDLSEETEIVRAAVLGSTGGKLGKYRLYVSNSTSDLFSEKNQIFEYNNTGNYMRQIISLTDGTVIKGRYFGFSYLAQSGVKIGALQLFGRCFDITANRTADVKKENTDLSREEDIKLSVVGASRGDGYSDFTALLPDYYDISRLVLKFGDSPATKYEVYLSAKQSSITYSQNIIAEITSPEANGCVSLTPKNDRLLRGTLITVRAYGKDYSAERFSDIGISGISVGGDTVINPYSVVSDDTAEMPARADNLISGKTPDTVYTYNYYPNTTVKNINSISVANLTDGDLANEYNCGEARFAFNSDGKDYFYRNGEYTLDITFDLGKLCNIDEIMLYSHRDAYLRTSHYILYLGNTADELYNNENIIADYVNVNAKRRQLFTGYRTGKFVGLRILDPCDSCGAVNNVYPRLWEFAVYGSAVADNEISFNGYSVNDGIVFGIPFGLNAKTLMSKCNNTSANIFENNDYISGKTVLSTGMTVNDGGNSVQIAVGGDVNGDNRVTVTDILKICSEITDGKLTDVQRRAADLDMNENINVTDVLRVADLIFYGNDVKNIEAKKEFNPENGTPVTGNTRVVDVDLDTVISDNFIGLGANVFPSNLTPEGRLKTGYNKVCNELVAERYATISPHYARMWFQLDWMITNEYDDYIYDNIPNFSRDSDISAYNTYDEQTGEWIYHPKGNPNVSVREADNLDCQNYKNGIYALESEEMKSVYDHVQLLGNADTNVCLNFGWKSATRIQSWFNLYFDTDPSHTLLIDNKSRNTAPKDLDSFAQACASLVDYMLNEKHLDNLTAISFYNEPYQADFQTPDDFQIDEGIWWCTMYKKCHDALEKKGLLDRLNVTGTEDSNPDVNQRGYATQLHDLYDDIVDAYTFHFYFYDGTGRDYHYMRKVFESYHYFFENKPIYITECYGHQMVNYNDSVSYTWTNWNCSCASLFIGSANVGVKACLVWTMSGGYLTDPSGWMLGSGIYGTWDVPVNENVSKNVHMPFYEESLFTNYIPRGSDVVSVDWTGEDIRATAFKLPDGNITVVVEADGTNPLVAKNSKGTPNETEYVKDYGDRVLKLCFGEKLNKTFYKFSFVPEVVETYTKDTFLNQQATVLHNYETLNLQGRTLTDNIDGNYAYYLYTTMQPIKQIQLGKNIWQPLSVGASINLSASLIDCAANDEIVWSITEATNSSAKGTISETNGTSTVYTASPSAKSGDMIAVRASLKSNPKRVFAVTVIKIK